MSFFFGRDKQPSLRGKAFMLTESGRAKLQDFGGDPQSTILVTLETAGSSLDLDELARQSHMSRGQLERVLPSMVRKGYISTGGGMAEYG